MVVVHEVTAEVMQGQEALGPIQCRFFFHGVPKNI